MNIAGFGLNSDETWKQKKDKYIQVNIVAK